MIKFPPVINADVYRKVITNRVAINEALNQVSSYFHVGLRELVGDSRLRTVSRTRQVAMYLLHRHLSFTLNQVGVALGGRDHSTILHGIRATEMRAEQFPEFAAQLDEMKRRLTDWEEKSLRMRGGAQQADARCVGAGKD